MNGLDIVELGAVLGALPEAFANDGEGKKAAWRDGVQAKLKELTASEARGTLPRSLARHPAYGGLAVGALDPSAPLPRKAAVASGAYGKAEVPLETGGLKVRVAALLDAAAPKPKPTDAAAPGADAAGPKSGDVARAAAALGGRLTLRAPHAVGPTMQEPTGTTNGPTEEEADI